TNNVNNINNITFETTIEVGPGLALTDPCEVNWESLTPSTLVLIHYRAEPYRCKFALATAGTAEAPLVVRGVPAPSGDLPVITGEDALTPLALDYWNEVRSVVKVGGVSHSSDFPSYISIENLEIRSARPAYDFTDDSGSAQTFVENAAAIHVEEGDHITVRGCTLTDSGNGFFAGSASSYLLLEGNYIHGNGIEGSIYEHNNYTESDHITFQYNHFGPLRDGCPGNNLKDRSKGTVIRFNWIEAGNRTIDLVDSDYEDFYNDPAYAQTHVYGNILIKHDVEENGQVLHYGGDSGDFTRYRKGTLWFYNNTVISYRSGNTTLLGISSGDESAVCFNNVIYATAGGTYMAISGGEGIIALENNWLPTGWREVHGSNNGTITPLDNIEETDPGFTDFSGGDYTLGGTSDAIDGGRALEAALASYPLSRQYLIHQSSEPRPVAGANDPGAFEHP
ncbi:right-handed parallel beta-helix repeat-containing protein, partial [Myxococcota bacterium]|nr:right-handed parallel beta-helix repeat-containing protein [Myxococcota bacterium]